MHSRHARIAIGANEFQNKQCNPISGEIVIDAFATTATLP